jgi:hypothetical protein
MGGQNNKLQGFESLGDDDGEYRTLFFCPPHSILCINLVEARVSHRTNTKTCENLNCNFAEFSVPMGGSMAVEHRFIAEIGEQVSKGHIESLTTVAVELLALVVGPHVSGHSFTESESAVLVVMKAEVERQGIAG